MIFPLGLSQQFSSVMLFVWFSLAFAGRKAQAMTDVKTILLGARRQLTNAVSAFLAVAFLTAIGSSASSSSGSLVALRADQLDVGKLNGHFLRQAATLHVALAALHMLEDAIDAFDHQLAGGVIYRQHLGLGAAVIPGNNFHHVASFNMH
jgi:hypothetical protein